MLRPRPIKLVSVFLISMLADKGILDLCPSYGVSSPLPIAGAGGF